MNKSAHSFHSVEIVVASAPERMYICQASEQPQPLPRLSPRVVKSTISSSADKRRMLKGFFSSSPSHI